MTCVPFVVASFLQLSLALFVYALAHGMLSRYYTWMQKKVAAAEDCTEWYERKNGGIDGGGYDDDDEHKKHTYTQQTAEWNKNVKHGTSQRIKRVKKIDYERNKKEISKYLMRSVHIEYRIYIFLLLFLFGVSFAANSNDFCSLVQYMVLASFSRTLALYLAPVRICHSTLRYVYTAALQKQKL